MRILFMCVANSARSQCPTLLSRARKLHWPHPDPAGKGASDQEKLQLFRQARDAIRAKLEAFGREHRLLGRA